MQLAINRNRCDLYADVEHSHVGAEISHRHFSHVSTNISHAVPVRYITGRLDTKTV